MAECTGLENQQGLIAPREFKSLLLRHLFREAGTYSFKYRLFAFYRLLIPRSLILMLRSLILTPRVLMAMPAIK